MNDWKAPLIANGEIRRPRRTYFPDIDMSFTIKEARAILNASGAKTLLACRDRCCPNVTDMLDHSDTHFLNRRWRQINELNRVPIENRFRSFISNNLIPTISATAKAALLHLDSIDLTKRILRRHQTTEAFRRIFEDNAIIHSASRSAALSLRAHH